MKNFILILLILFTTFSYGQVVNVKGKLTFTNGKPVAMAIVFVENTPLYAYTDEQGNFELTNVKPGTYDVLFQYFGRDPEKATIKVSKTNSSLNYSLHYNEENNLEEVTVVGVSQEAKIETKGFAVESVSTELVKEQAIEVNTVIDNIPGITVRQTGGLGSRTSYNINGLAGNAVRFFIDGVPMEYYGSAYSVNSLPVGLVDNIEVYKGVVPIGLGGDALGGAVNICTNTNTKTSLNASYSIGSFNTHQASLNGSYKENKTNFVTKGSVFYNYTDNNYKVWGPDIYISDPETGRINRDVSAIRFHDAYKNLGTKIDIGFVDKKWADQIFIGITYADMYKEVQHGATMNVPFGERYYTQQTVMPNLIYNKKDFLLDKLDVDYFIGYSKQNRHVVDTTHNRYNWNGEIIKVTPEGGEAGASTLSLAKENSLISRLNLRYEFNKNNAISFNQVWSAFDRFMDDEKADIGKRTLDNEQRIKKNIMGLSYEKKSFNNRLLTNLFCKYYGYHMDVTDAEFDIDQQKYIPKFYSRKDNNYGYGFASSYRINNNWLLQASYEKTVRLPSTNEIFGNAAQNIQAVYQLKPEKSDNVNIGFRYNLFKDGGHHFAISNNFFYRDVRDLIQPSTQIIGGVEFFMNENLSKIISKGIDLQFDYHYNNKLSAMFATSYTDARDKDKYDSDGRPSWSYNSRLKNAPYFQFNTSLRYSFANTIKHDDKVSLYWNTRYVHAFFRYWENIGRYAKDTIPSQFVNNIGVNYKFPNDKWSMSFDIRNLFNEQVFDNFAIQQPGRGFYLKINYKLL